MRQRVYISGPLTTSGNPMENIDRAMVAARELIAAGYAPLVPHLNYMMDLGEEIPREIWLEVELPWVRAADAMIRLPGESIGADLEVERAELLGIPVFGSVAALVASCPAARPPAAEQPTVDPVEALGPPDRMALS